MKISLRSVVSFFVSAKKIILLILLVSLITLVVTTVTSIWLSKYHNLHFPSLGTIHVIGVEVYGGDINITEDGIPYIDWGTIYPGTFTNRSFYIKSNSSVSIMLRLRTSSVTFQSSEDQNVTEGLPIENPLNLTWTYDDTPLDPAEEIYVTITLEASSDLSFLEYLVAYDVSKFSFDIIITPL